MRMPEDQSSKARGEDEDEMKMPGCSEGLGMGRPCRYRRLPLTGQADGCAHARHVHMHVVCIRTSCAYAWTPWPSESGKAARPADRAFLPWLSKGFSLLTHAARCDCPAVRAWRDAAFTHSSSAWSIPAGACCRGLWRHAHGMRAEQLRRDVKSAWSRGHTYGVREAEPPADPYSLDSGYLDCTLDCSASCIVQQISSTVTVTAGMPGKVCVAAWHMCHTVSRCRVTAWCF